MLSFIRSKFLRSVVTLMTGSVLSQVITIVTTPILSRIYSPAEYGIYGLYGSYTAILAILGGSIFSQAIIIPKSDDDATEVFLGSNFFCGLISVFVLIIIIVTNLITGFVKNSEMGLYYYTLPLMTLINAFYSSLMIWANRQKEYKVIARNRVVNSIVLFLFSFILGYILGIRSGLILSFLISHTIALGLLFFSIQRRSPLILYRLTLTKLKTSLLKYPKFLFYGTPAGLINSFTNQLPILMLNKYGGADTAGYFNMSKKVLGLPTTFIASAVTDVFKQRAADDLNNKGSLHSIFNATFKSLFSISVLPYALLIAFAPTIFKLVLGPEWQEAGVYTQIVGIMYLFRFVISPLSYVIILSNKLQISLFMDIYLFISSFIIFYLTLVKAQNIHLSLTFYALNYSILYLVTLFISYRVAKTYRKNIS